MLRDTPIRQVPGDLPRKWMMDGEMELILWFDEQQHLFGFELVYDRFGDQRSLRWTPNAGLSHHRIDDGERTGRIGCTPILRDGGPADIASVSARFQQHAADLPAPIRDFVLRRLCG